MSENISLQLEKYLPPQVLELVKDAGRRANELGQELYLVGGMIRDLFLGHINSDLDLVVEGDALRLAKDLAKDSQAKLIIHTRFGTARLDYTDFSLDIATARCESYSQPGALPVVRPGSITDDLSRRDFSVNAMAMHLTPRRFGEMIDFYHGKEDLRRGLIRILHPNSFIDDSTRILRALRYEQRLDFELEMETSELLRRDAAMLYTISGDRLRHELELILSEAHPERVLRRADGLGVLNKLHPSLEGNGWLDEKFDQARQSYKASLSTLYLCLLIYNLTEEENEQFISRFNFPKKLIHAMRHTLQLKAHLHSLAEPQLKPSDIYQLLNSHAIQAIQVNALASESQVISQRMQLYLTRLRYIKPFLNGEDLKRLGIISGYRLGEILEALHRARLNGEVRTRKDEEELVCNWRL